MSDGVKGLADDVIAAVKTYVNAKTEKLISDARERFADVEGTVERFKARLTSFGARIDAIEARTIQLGARESSGLDYKGVWADGFYRKGAVVTRDSSMWACMTDTVMTPGTSPDWKLCVKRGRDGKEGAQGPRGAVGPEGPQGPEGPPGPMPRHEWRGTELRFEQRPGQWGPYTDLQGPRGPQGDSGIPQGIGRSGGIPAIATSSVGSYFPTGW